MINTKPELQSDHMTMKIGSWLGETDIYTFDRMITSNIADPVYLPVVLSPLAELFKSDLRLKPPLS